MTGKKWLLWYRFMLCITIARLQHCPSTEHPNNSSLLSTSSHLEDLYIYAGMPALHQLQI